MITVSFWKRTKMKGKKKKSPLNQGETQFLLNVVLQSRTQEWRSREAEGLAVLCSSGKRKRSTASASACHLPRGFSPEKKKETNCKHKTQQNKWHWCCRLLISHDMIKLTTKNQNKIKKIPKPFPPTTKQVPFCFSQLLISTVHLFYPRTHISSRPGFCCNGFIFFIYFYFFAPHFACCSIKFSFLLIEEGKKLSFVMWSI